MVNFLDGKVKNESCDQLLQMLVHDFKDAECSVVTCALMAIGTLCPF